MAKPALGRGLGALMSGNPPLTQPASTPIIPPPVTTANAPDNRDRVQRVALNRIRPSALQPRKEFAAEALQELADSIREQGIVQPLIVRERDGFFELIAGERRWRAAQLLNPLEEAVGYAQLAEQFQLTQEDIATKVGKSRAAVANATRLLKLPASVQSFLRDGRISVGHAKVILGLADETNQKLAAERIIKEGLNVRQTEGLVAKLQARGQKISGDSAKPLAIVPVDSNIARLEEKMREKFGTKVHLKYAHGKGAMEISFISDDELQRVLEILGVDAD